MSEYLQYAYVFVWGALAVLTFIIGKKQDLYYFVLSLFFVFMTVWYALNSFGGIAMFEGALGIAFRCIALLFLAAVVFVYFLRKKSKAAQSNENTDDSEE